MAGVDVLQLINSGEDIDAILDASLAQLEQMKFNLGTQVDLVSKNSQVITQTIDADLRQGIIATEKAKSASTQAQSKAKAAMRLTPSRITSRGKR